MQLLVTGSVVNASNQEATLDHIKHVYTKKLFNVAMLLSALCFCLVFFPFFNIRADQETDASGKMQQCIVISAKLQNYGNDNESDGNEFSVVDEHYSGDS